MPRNSRTEKEAGSHSHYLVEWISYDRKRRQQIFMATSEEEVRGLINDAFPSASDVRVRLLDSNSNKTTTIY